MKPHLSLDRQAARISLTCCVIAGALAALPAATSATSLAATHAPDGVVHVAIVTSAGDQDITVALSAGLMDGASRPLAQIQLDTERIDVTRSVGLMQGASGKGAQAKLAGARRI